MRPNASTRSSLFGRNTTRKWSGAGQLKRAETALVSGHGMNGGVMEQSYTKYVFPAFERIHNVKVVVVPGTSSDILAKVQASKERPPVHVMFLDDGVMMRAVKLGLCQRMGDFPVLKDLYPSARIAG